MTVDPRFLEVCKRYGATPMLPSSLDKVGIALQTLHLQPINGLRHPPEGGTCGWYIWGGPELSQDDDFFQPLHVHHLVDRLPVVLPYLALRPGWHFLVAPGQEDIWYNEALLET